MKVTYTHAEAVQKLRDLLVDQTGDSHAIVEILQDPPKLVDILLSKVGTSIPYDQKIAKIKALRTVSEDCKFGTMGLANAKYAIENWDRFIEFVKLHERFPSDGYWYTEGMK